MVCDLIIDSQKGRIKGSFSVIVEISVGINGKSEKDGLAK